MPVLFGIAAVGGDLGGGGYGSLAPFPERVAVGAGARTLHLHPS